MARNDHHSRFYAIGYQETLQHWPKPSTDSWRKGMIIPVGDINPRRSIPIVNYILIAINIIAFVWLYFRPDYSEIVRHYGFTPGRLEASLWPQVALADQIPEGRPVWFELITIITAMFLHADIWHLMGNMLFLWIAGDNVEDRLGRLTYLVVYLMSGVAAAFVHFHFSKGDAALIPCVGASGAISGVLGMYMFLFPRNRIKFVYFLPLILFLHIGRFTMRSVFAIGFWFIMQLFYGLATTHYESMTGVAYWAHIGGFVFGLAVIAVLKILGLEGTGQTW